MASPAFPHREPAPRAPDDVGALADELALVGLRDCNGASQPFALQRSGGAFAACTLGSGDDAALTVRLGRHEHVGAGLVNRCADELLAVGALPAFATGRLAHGGIDAASCEALLLGVVRGCRGHGIPLPSFATAPRAPGIAPAAFDLTVTLVGEVREGAGFDGPPRAGDAILGMFAPGLQGHGVALAERALARLGIGADAHVAALGTTAGRALTAVARSHGAPLRKPLLERWLRVLAPVGAGGLLGALRRLSSASHGSCGAVLRANAWQPPPLFPLLARAVDVATLRGEVGFGLGMLVVCAREQEERVLGYLRAWGEACVTVGELVAGAAPRIDD